MLIYISLFFIGIINIFGQQSRPPGVDSVVITFQNPPVVTVKKAPLKYNKAFAMSFQMDDAISDIFEKVYPVFQGNGVTPGLTFTDGCGHPVTFKMSSGVYIFSSNNNSDILKSWRYHDQGKLTWAQLDTLYRNHWGLENHGLFDNPDASSPEKIEFAFQRTESYARRKISDSVSFRSFVIPNGLDVYVSYLPENNYHAAINQGHDNSWIGFGDIGVDVDSDTIDWLKPTKLNRLFLYSEFKEHADSLYAQSERGIHKWLLSGMHTLPGNFLVELKEIYDTYGSPGLDDILLASDDEILDYLAVKQAIQVHNTLVGNKLTVTFSGSVPTDRLYYALSLNVLGNQPIEKIQVYGAENSSFQGVGKDTALVNLSWDGRYYYPTEMLADSFTNLAMTTRSEWKALVAMDYVTRLPSGEKKIRLQDSLCSLDQSGWRIGYDAGFCNLVHLGADTALCPGDSLLLNGPENMAAYNWYQNGLAFSTTSSVTVFPDSATAYALIVKDKSGNEMGDTINVTVFSIPKVELGADTGLCAGSNLTLSVPKGDYTYYWSNGDTLSSVAIRPVSDTTISVNVSTKDGCRVSDSIHVIYHLPPEISIPQDSNSHCFGDSVTLTVSGTDPGLSYHWNTGDTASAVSFLPSIADTTYRFLVTALSPDGCRATDTARVFVLPQLPDFHIGSDTNICSGSCISFHAPSGNYTYEWSTGDTTTSVRVCPVSDTTISLTVFTPEMCSGTDSVYIAYFLPPDISIPEDGTSYCYGDSIFLQITSGNPGVNFLWNTGDTTSVISVKNQTPDTTYIYSVKATSLEGCTAMDTAHIIVLPEVAVKMDTNHYKTCDGRPITISCSAVQGDFTSYAWYFDGNTFTTDTNSFTLLQPAISDWVHVVATDRSGCAASDSAFLNTVSYPDIIIPADTSVCAGDSLHLSGSGGEIFYWLHGTDTLSEDSVLNVIPLQQTTYYAVSGLDHLCLSRDSLIVSLNLPPETKIVKGNGPVCMNTPLTLKASGADSYRWMPGNISGDTFLVKPADTLMIYLTGVTTEGCSSRDSLLLSPAPLPETHFSGLMPSYCENDPAITLKGEPEGGVFSGEGISDAAFSPAIAGPGNHTIYYTFTSHDGCAGKSKKETYVYGPVPAIHLTPEDTTLLPGGAVQYDAGAGFDAYYWTTGDLTRKINVDYNEFPVGTDTIRVVGITGGCSSVGSAAIIFGEPAGFITTRVEPLSIYPNPAHQVVSVSFRGNGKPITIEIFNVSGKRILRKRQPACLGNCSVKLNISHMKPGIYSVWLYNETGSYFSKMIVQ